MAGSSSWSRDQYIEQFDFPFCEEVSKYEKQAKIGQGTFGEVFKARDRKNKNKVVALKKVLMENEKEGFPITALREIRILQLLRHENIVNLIEICRTRASQYNRYKSTFYLVFDFCEHDLAGLLSNVNVKFSLGEIKKVMQQLLNGLYFIHSQKILHRDMKVMRRISGGITIFEQQKSIIREKNVYIFILVWLVMFFMFLFLQN